MTRLTVYRDDTPDIPELRTESLDDMVAALTPIDVRLERWNAPVAIAPTADAETILAAYRPHLDRLMGETGAGSADVLKLTPDHPDGAALRAKFLNEHRHSEAEVRFFVAGSGHFILHANDRIYDVLCTAGDLIHVPAGIRHWFDAGQHPSFTALRIYTNTAGWIAHFTGDPISDRFPAA